MPSPTIWPSPKRQVEVHCIVASKSGAVGPTPTQSVKSVPMRRSRSSNIACRVSTRSPWLRFSRLAFGATSMIFTARTLSRTVISRALSALVTAGIATAAASAAMTTAATRGGRNELDIGDSS